MSNFKTLDLSIHWGGGVTVKGADVKNVSRQAVERAQQEQLQRMQAEETSTRTVHLDANYTQAATHNLTQHDVTVSNTILSRMSKAPEHVQEHINNSLRALQRNRTYIDKFEKLKRAAEGSGNLERATKYGRQLRQAALMVSATSEELRIAYIAGSQTTAFDAKNEYGNSQKFRTDIEMRRELIEVTIGERKPSKQLNDYLLAAKASEKDLYLHGPLMTNAGIRFAEKYGFTVGKTYEDVFRFITRPKLG